MDYKDINDYELLYLVKDEDDNYKGILFSKYTSLIKKICYEYFQKFRKYVDSYDDLYQEASIGLNYAIDHFNLQKNVTFYSYALLCIKCKLKDYITKSTRNKNLIVKDAISIYTEIGDDIYLEDVIATDDTAYQTVLYHEQVSFLVRFKNDLSSREAQVFELRFHGFTYQEIAILLDIKRENIYSYLKQVKLKFKKFNYEDCFF